jgi:cytochrome oxidase Cu insertion factor (SCO1/SenC/PrrC family)
MKIVKRASVAMMTSLLVLIFSSVCPQIQAQTKKPEPQPMKLKTGDTAPDFKLKNFDGTDLKDVSLSEYRGKKNVVLAFYIFAFTGG